MAHLFGRKPIGLIVAVLCVLAWLGEPETAREDTRLLLARGEPGVQTTSLAVSPAGKLLATTDTAGRVALRNGERGWGIERFLALQGHARAAVFSADGRYLVSGRTEPGLTVWDLWTSGNEQTLPIPIERVTALALSRDGQTLAGATGLNGNIVVWDIAAGRVRTILWGPFPAQSLAFSPDGRSLVSGGRDGKAVILWDLETGGRRILLKEPSGPISSVAFSADGTMLAAACPFDRHVRLWDLSSIRPCRQIGDHAYGTNSVAFSPAGTTLATAGNDGMVRLWRVATGEQLASLDGQSAGLASVAFSADGRTLAATGIQDNDVRLWELTELVRDSIPRSRPAPISWEDGLRPPGGSFFRSLSLTDRRCWRYL